MGASPFFEVFGCQLSVKEGSCSSDREYLTQVLNRQPKGFSQKNRTDN